MPYAPTATEEIRTAVARLQKSDAGFHALSCLNDLLDGQTLDAANQNAVLTLLVNAWGPLAGTTRDEIANAV